MASKSVCLCSCNLVSSCSIQGVWSVDFKPVSNSTLLCSGSEDGTVRMWDARSNRLARRFEGGHTAPVYCVRWSPDGAMLATGSEDCKVSYIKIAIFV